MGLCIGTVQFGMHYGIASKEHPTPEQSIEILEYAADAGIRTIDTAFGYGNAEEIVGRFLNGKKRSDFRIVTKIKPDALNGIEPENYYKALKQHTERSLENLKTDYVDGCLFHNAAYIYKPHAQEALSRLKQDKITLKTGVSIYLPDEYTAASQNADLIQIPFNLLNQKLVPYLNKKRPELEIHARSVFLQGLLLMKENEVPSHLSGVIPYLRLIDEFCGKLNITRNVLLLAFVRAQKNINEIVFGVDSLQHLKQIIADYTFQVESSTVLDFAKYFENVDDYILMPNLWRGDNK